MHVGQNSIEGIGVGHFDAPRMSVVDEEHLLWRVLLKSWQSLLHDVVRLSPVFVGLHARKPRAYDRSLDVVTVLTKYDSRRPPLSAISSPCV